VRIPGVDAPLAKQRHYLTFDEITVRRRVTDEDLGHDHVLPLPRLSRRHYRSWNDESPRVLAGSLFRWGGIILRLAVLGWALEGRWSL